MGHVLRYDRLLLTVLEGMLEGKSKKVAGAIKCWTTFKDNETYAHMEK
jgi:hypothetical protein